MTDRDEPHSALEGPLLAVSADIERRSPATKPLTNEIMTARARKEAPRIAVTPTQKENPPP
jgi:hypothetical protein